MRGISPSATTYARKPKQAYKEGRGGGGGCMHAWRSCGTRPNPGSGPHHPGLYPDTLILHPPKPNPDSGPRHPGLYPDTLILHPPKPNPDSGPCLCPDTLIPMS